MIDAQNADDLNYIIESWPRAGGNAQRPIACRGGHGIAGSVLGGVVTSVIDLYERYDLAGGRILDDKVDDLLSEGVAIGMQRTPTRKGWRLQKGAHRNLGVDPIGGKNALELGKHGALTLCHERLGYRPRWTGACDISTQPGQKDSGQAAYDDQRQRAAEGRSEQLHDE
jgi:hypothetical protein